VTARILIIEDNKDLALGLRVNFEDGGYQVRVAHTAGDGLAKLRQHRSDLVVLDLALPDGDGLDLVRGLRAAGDETLVLMLTANARQTTKVVGLRAGADDYVTKPFDLEELLVRVEVLLRRRRGAEAAAPGQAADRLSAGDVTIDVPARVAYRANEALPLSRMAFDLLVALVRHRGAVITRAELMREVWGYSEGVVSRTLDTHIFELRRLIESDPAKPTRIRTVWRIGYRFD
jgi:DNA-binding response OmpR family regulator